MCDGNTGAILGAIAGYALAPATGGASLALAAGAGSMAGSALIDQPAAQKKAMDAQSRASDIAIGQAKASASAADQAFNRANGKSPDVMGLMDANKMTAKGGQSGTMLTGTQGIDPTALLLGKKTLLGA